MISWGSIPAAVTMMPRPLRAIALATMLLLAAPSAAAGDHGSPGPDEHVRLLAEADVGEERYYVLEDHGEVLLFRETNGVTFGGVDGSGAQPAWSCVETASLTYVHESDGCAAGTKTPPDARVTNGALLAEVVRLLHDAEHELLP